MPGRTTWTMVRSCRETTLSEVKKDKNRTKDRKDRIWRIFHKLRFLALPNLTGGEKATELWRKAHARASWSPVQVSIYTGNSDALGTNWSRKIISDATWITECSIFAAAQISLMLTHLQPKHEKPTARNLTEPGIPMSTSADRSAQDVLRVLLPLRVSSGSNRRTSHSAVLQTKPRSCAKGQAKGKVGILILPT